MTPGIAVVIVGEDPASQVYVRSKGKHGRGMRLQVADAPPGAGDERGEAALALLAKLNADDTIHGILVQLPLPKHIDEGKIIQAIAPHKDVDGFHFINVGKLGTGETASAFVPCTPAGSMLLIEKALGTRDLSGLNAVVVGRSNIVGKPMANLLLLANCHRHHRPFAHQGSASAGAHRGHSGCGGGPSGNDQGRLGEARRLRHRCRHQPDRGWRAHPAGRRRRISTPARPVAGSITPVPGGVGPMTIAMLMANTLKGACIAAGVEPPSY